MEQNDVVNEENETLKLQLKICGVIALGFLFCGLLGVGQYFPQILVCSAILFVGFKFYQIKKNKKSGVAK